MARWNWEKNFGQKSFFPVYDTEKNLKNLKNKKNLFWIFSPKSTFFRVNFGQLSDIMGQNRV